MATIFGIANTGRLGGPGTRRFQAVERIKRHVLTASCADLTDLTDKELQTALRMSETFSTAYLLTLSTISPSSGCFVTAQISGSA